MSTFPMLSPTGDIGDVPVENVGEAVKGGLKLGQDMLSPDGQSGVIPYDQVHGALAKGFKLKGAPPAAPKADMQEQPLSKAEQSILPSDMPGASEGHNMAEGLGDWVEDVGGHVHEGAKDILQGNVARGLHKILGGAAALTLPALPFAAAAGPGVAARALAGGTVGGKLAKAGANALGATEDQADLAGDAGTIVGGARAGKNPDFGKPALKAAGKVTGVSDAIAALRKGLEPHIEAEAAADEVATRASDIPADEWEAGHDIETKVENTPKPAPTPGQKAAAEKAFLEHLGKTKEDIQAAQTKQKVAYQKHLTKAAKKGADFGPRGGVTPELHEQAKAAGRAAYLKHLGIEEMDFATAKSAARQGAMDHYKKSLEELAKNPKIPSNYDESKDQWGVREKMKYDEEMDFATAKSAARQGAMDHHKKSLEEPAKNPKIPSNYDESKDQWGVREKMKYDDLLGTK